MKIPSQNFIVKGTVYPFDVMFSLNQTDDELTAYLRGKTKNYKRSVKELALSSTSQGKSLMTNENQTIVRLIKFDDSPQQKGYLTHEIFHACSFILHEAGVEYKFDISDEAYAYLIGWLTQEFYSNLKTKK